MACSVSLARPQGYVTSSDGEVCTLCDTTTGATTGATDCVCNSTTILAEYDVDGARFYDTTGNTFLKKCVSCTPPYGVAYQGSCFFCPYPQAGS